MLHNIITELEQLYRCSSGYQDIRHLILCEARQVRSELNQFLAVNPELAVALDALEPAVDILKLKTWGLNRLSALRSQLPEGRRTEVKTFNRCSCFLRHSVERGHRGRRGR